MRKEDRSLLLEQYKMAVASAEQVSKNRADANKFYLSINSIILGGVLFYDHKVASLPKLTVVIVSIFGLVICVTWFLALLDYKRLNSAKFKVIHKIEKNLPVQFYEDEWDILNARKPWYQKYKYLSKVERVLPITFALLYIVLAILVAFISC